MKAAAAERPPAGPVRADAVAADAVPADATPWRPAALNRGWSYHDRIGPGAAGLTLTAYYASRYRHSSPAEWRARLAAGEILCNGRSPESDAVLCAGDRLVWRRPPWREPSVPDAWRVVHDDGDLLVIDKPSGLPVLPAGGYLEHTLLRMLERGGGAGPGAAGLPRPVHRLGRFTSGLLVCARRPATRAWLSARLRESTAAAPGEPCSKVYRALTAPLPDALEPGLPVVIRTPIGRCPHPLLGTIWCAAPGGEAPGALPAESRLTLLERRPDGCLVEVAIRTGRPHQIRIHTAALGAPLLGDPLYLPGGGARAEALPGAGGYRLHAHRLALPLPGGGVLELEAPLPAPLLPAGG